MNIFIIIVDPERRQWRWPNYIAFWIADSLNIVGTPREPPHATGEEKQKEKKSDQSIEHMDDFFLNDRRRTFMVAVMALRLGGIFRGCVLRDSNGADRCCLSHFISSNGSRFIRNLGIILACDKPSRDGHHLVWCAKLHWRFVSSYPNKKATPNKL